MFLRKWYKLFILLVLCLLITWYLLRNPQAFMHLSRLSLWQICLLLFFRAGFLLISGLVLKAFAEKFHVKLTRMEWVGLSFVTALGNYISPFSGGMIFRAGFLKMKHDLSLAKFSALLASNYLIIFWCVSVTGFFCSLFIRLTEGTISWLLPLFFGTAALSLVVLRRIRLPKISSQRWYMNKVDEMTDGLKIIKQDRLLLGTLVGYTFLNIMLNGLSFYVAFKSIGIEIYFSQALIISLIAVFSLLINITPANLGVQEAVVCLASTGLQYGLDEGLIVALIVRAATMLLVFTLGPVFFWLLTKKEQLQEKQGLS